MARSCRSMELSSLNRSDARGRAGDTTRWGLRRAVGYLMRLPSMAVLALLRFYKFRISPEIRSRTCRYEPSCSVYAYEAIDRYGLIKGGILSYCRLRRCSPDFPSGYDPVPSVRRRVTVRRAP